MGSSRVLRSTPTRTEWPITASNTTPSATRPSFLRNRLARQRGVNPTAGRRSHCESDCLHPRSSPAHDKGDDEQDEENEEQNLRDSDSSSRNPTKAKDGGDDCDNEEGNGPANHNSVEVDFAGRIARSTVPARLKVRNIPQTELRL